MFRLKNTSSTNPNLWLEVERKGSVLVIVELAVGRLAGGPDAVEAQLSRSGLAGVDEAANVAAEGSETQPVAGANHLQDEATSD